jgi:predicted ATPase
MLELRAATSMARLMIKLNRQDAAIPALHSVCSRFPRQQSNPDLLEARTILDRIRAAP